MNINNIKLGETYKNWKALCEVLGVEPKSASYKAKQERDFKQYFDWTKEGQKITITEIYKEKQERLDGRGKSENSQKALRENKGHRKPLFNYDDELQLMILLYLARRTYSENLELGRRENAKYFYTVGASTLFVQTGLCSNYYTDVLSKNGYYLIGTTEQIRRGEALYTRSEFKEAFRDFYKHMQSDTKTALDNLRKRKVLDYYETKSWFDGKEWHPCSDEEMQCIVEAREDAIDWWNSCHEKQLKEAYDLYNQWTLTPREKDEVFEWMNNRLKETIHNSFVCYTSSYKIFCSERSIKRQLTNIGFEELIEDKKKADEKLKEVSEKNLNLQLDRTLEKRRLEDLAKKEEYDNLDVEYKKVRGLNGRGGGRIVTTTKKQYAPLANDEIYNNAKELLKQGIFGINDEEKQKVAKVMKNRGC